MGCPLVFNRNSNNIPNKSSLLFSIDNFYSGKKSSNIRKRNYKKSDRLTKRDFLIKYLLNPT